MTAIALARHELRRVICYLLGGHRPTLAEQRQLVVEVDGRLTHSSVLGWLSSSRWGCSLLAASGATGARAA